MLSKTTKYAIRALVFIQLQNWNRKRPGVIEIAREIEAPAAFTGKILHTLTRHQLLGSMKGRGGGFFFPDNQSNLTLYEIIHVLDGDSLFNACGFGMKNCSDINPCPMHDEYKKLREGYFELAHRETIQSLSQKIYDGKAYLNRAIL